MIPRCCVFALVLAASVPAQQFLAYTPGGPPLAAMASASALPMPAGFVQGMVPLPFPLPPAFPGPGAVVVPPGGLAVNSMTGRIYYSNGPMIAASPDVRIPGTFAPPTPPFPSPPFPPPPPLVVAPFVSGMAVDPVAGLLWLTNGITVQAVFLAPLPAIAIAVPPFVPALPPGAPFSGLEWDGITGTLWLNTMVGMVWQITPAGVLAGGPFPPPIALPGIATGLTLDKSGLPAPPPVIPGGPGRSVYVFAGPAIVNYASGFVAPAPVGPGVGLAFQNLPILTAPGGCACGPLNPTLSATSPMTTGAPAYSTDWVGLPPFAPVYLGLDVVFDPAFPLVNATGCPLGLNLISPSLAVLILAADATGRFTFPVSFVGIPPGIGPFYVQYATLCPADPVAGIVLSSLMHVVISGT